MKIRVGTIHDSIKISLVGRTDLVANDESGLLGHFGRLAVVQRASHQELNSSLDPFVAMLVIVEFVRDVVRQVVSLKFPNLLKVRLQFDDLINGGRSFVKSLFLLVFDRLRPKNVGRDSAQAEVEEPKKKRTGKKATKKAT